MLKIDRKFLFVLPGFLFFSVFGCFGQSDVLQTPFEDRPNMGVVPKNTSPQFEVVHPQPSASDFEDALQKKQALNLEREAREKLNTKGILSAEQMYEEDAKKAVDEFNSPYKKTDQNLGGFSSQTKQVTIYCRDFASADGDRVTIYLNETAVVRNIELYEGFQRFALPLEIGLNQIAFKALNQGSSGPNTAAFVIVDEQGTVLSSNQWNLATGAKAFLTIARDR